ncbi:MAG TPA: ABC transporter ATP-binding protein [Xanthobacteraceae bacterium]
MPRTAAIEAAGLCKTYVTVDGEIPALDRLTFRVEPGEFVSVLGPSGCGKTTLMRIVAGLTPPTMGAVAVDGVPVSGPQRKIGLVFQIPALMQWRSALDNVLLPTEILGLDRAASRKRARELLELVGLAEFASRYPRELSGGMQQRVGIARALVHDPAILLLDEPFSALDIMTRNQLNTELMRIWSERRKTNLLITHSIPEAVYLSDRVIVLGARPARILDIVAVALPRPREPAIRVSLPFMQLVDRIGRLIGLEYV